MNSQPLSSDATRSRLRATLASIDHELAGLSNQVATDETKHPVAALSSLWADLVRQLALGPEPEVRSCPICRSVGMRDATRCGHCWAKLSPLGGRGT